MTRKFFGTDGIRGTTNLEPMTAETALRVGQAAGAHFLRGDHRHRVVIGKDTRLSGYMMESAMVAGFTSVGMDVVLLGPMPTPAVAMLTRSMRADLGVMISASHNPFADNGIKLFGPDGYKLSDEAERAIEKRLGEGPKLAKPDMIGRARRIDDARGRYVQFAKDTFPDHLRLDGLKVVIDCANGAAYHVAPEALWELGAEVIPLGVTPNGLNINDDCGSTHPRAAAGDRRRERRRHRPRARRRRRPPDRRRREGPAGRRRPADGADRAGPAAARRAQGRRGGRDGHVQPRARAEARRGRTEARPDRRSATATCSRRCARPAATSAASNRGTSSSPIMRRPATGWSRGCRCWPRWSKRKAPASELLRQFEPLPQLLKNVRFNGGASRSRADSVRKRIAAAEAELEGRGRLVIRKSGTEPLIRVMAEGDDPALVERLVDDICEAVQTAA